MGTKIVLKKGPRYTGLRELIPGHIYLDKRGKELLFLGFCNISYPNREAIWGMGYTYMRVEQIEKKIQKGCLSSDLSLFENDPMDVSQLFSCSWTPHILVKDLGERYPSEKFRDMTIVQIRKGEEYLLHLKAVPGDIPFGHFLVD